MYPSITSEAHYLQWLGKPTPKKNSQQIVWSGISKVGVGGGVKGLSGLLHRIAKMRGRQQQVALIKAAQNVRPFVMPSSDFGKVQKLAVPQIQSQWRLPAAGTRTAPVEIKAIFHLGPRVTPDLDNLWTAMLDILQKSEVIANDYWVIRPHPDTHRRRCDKNDPDDQPRTEVWLWERPDLRNEVLL